MWLALPSLFIQLSQSSQTRVVILSGAGDRAFTTGLDLEVPSSLSRIMPSSSEKTTQDSARTSFVVQRYIANFQACVSAIAQCSKPVIAAIHGHCLGLGIDIISAADIRLATHAARFAVKEVDIGLAADVGTLSRLPKICGGGNMSWVKDVCLSARSFSASEAHSHGLVSWIGAPGLDPAAAKAEIIGYAMQMAAEIAAKSPVAVQSTKRLIDYSIDHSIADGLDYTAVWNAARLQTHDIAEAIAAGRQKRRPTFEKL